MKILFTGFDPFGDDLINPSWEAVKAMRDFICGAQIFKLMIPTVFVKSVAFIEDFIKHNNLDVIISVGQAGGRYGVTPERVAINIDDARIKDNEGNQPIDKYIYKDGKPAYFSSLPCKAMVKEIIDAGLPASLSNTAGTFVCNHVMYSLLYLAENKYPDIKAGFIHVPYIPEQVVAKPDMPSMSLSDITRALEACVKAIMENDKDLNLSFGTIS